MAVVLTIAGSAKTFRRNSLNISATANGRTTASFTVLSTDGSYRPALDAEVIITEGGTRIFGGLVNRPSEKGLLDGASNAIATAVSAVDFNHYPERRAVNETIAAGTLKAALTTLVANYLSVYGVTLDAGQVNGPTLTELKYEYRNLGEALNELSTLTAKYGDPYVWRIDEFKVLSMFQPTTSAAPFNIVINDGNVVGDIEVETNRDKYANRIIVKVAPRSEIGRVETFLGDGATDTVVLSQDMAANQRFVVVTPGGFMEPLGDGHPTGATWTIDADNRTLTRLTGPLPSGYTASVTYDSVQNINATAEDASEISTYGPWERVIVVDVVPDDTTAQALADGYLAQALALPKTIKYRTRRTGLKPGQTQTITITRRNLNSTVTITDVVTKELLSRELMRDVTAVTDVTPQGSWRDTYKLWAGDKSGGTTGITLPGAAAPTASGGIPGQPNKSVQFNFENTFGGDDGFLYDYTNDTVMVGSNHTPGGAINVLIGDGHTVN